MVKEYIEREAAIDAMTADNLLKHFDSVEDVIEKRFHRAAERILVKIPAADVAPVRRGRWIKDGEDGPVYCSECGEEHEWGDYRATYCDTCGAKMDGGQDE